MNPPKNIHAQILGRIGGKPGVPNKAKGHSPEQARRAVMVRWNKRKEQTWKVQDGILHEFNAKH